jgi:hypothetical protein
MKHHFLNNSPNSRIFADYQDSRRYLGAIDRMCEIQRQSAIDAGGVSRQREIWQPVPVRMDGEIASHLAH